MTKNRCFFTRANPHLRTIHVRVGGDRVVMTVHGRAGPAHDISVEMGRAHIGPGAVALDPSALVSSPADFAGAPMGDPASPRFGVMAGPSDESLAVVPVSVGNPHLVVACGPGSSTQVTEAHLAVVGPFLSEHPALSHGSNVQLAEPLEGSRCRALVWERGVGRTSSSGTSACAVAVAMVASGRIDPGPVAVEMPGGTLDVHIGADFDVVLRGPVEEICEGRLSESLIARLVVGSSAGSG